MKILTYERMTRIEKIFWYSLGFVGTAFVVLFIGGIIGIILLTVLYDLWINHPEILIMYIIVFSFIIIIIELLKLWIRKKEQLLREKEEPKETENEE